MNVVFLEKDWKLKMFRDESHQFVVDSFYKASSYVQYAAFMIPNPVGSSYSVWSPQAILVTVESGNLEV
ncbi:MAG: hypothetical protein M2R45_00545 [Verrucomicrobia subdivision 3 bacterium]|nr:hypothetical protein [Limisphaerales bacterium]MCS1413577.1 hypothetical protein [Limisphaerales bacterium]